MSGKDDPFGRQDGHHPQSGRRAAQARSGRPVAAAGAVTRTPSPPADLGGAFGAPQRRGLADAALADATACRQLRLRPSRRRSPSGAFRSRWRSMRRTRRNSRQRTRSPQAAAPLLILLGRLRLHIVDMQAVPLMNHVAQSITEFEKKIVAAGVNPQEALVAKYVAVRNRRRHRPEPARHRPRRLDAVLDARAVLPGADLRRRLLRGTEQGARQSGAALQSARADACLPARSASRASIAAPHGGDGELQRIRRDVYQTLRHVKAPAPTTRFRRAGAA